MLVVSLDALTLASSCAPPGNFGSTSALRRRPSRSATADFGGPSFGLLCRRGALHQEDPVESPAKPSTPTAAADSSSRSKLASSTFCREKATSNICTEPGAERACGMVYLAWLGKRESSSSVILWRSAPPTRANGWDRSMESISEPSGSGPRVCLPLEAPVASVSHPCAETRGNAGYALGRTPHRGRRRTVVAITESAFGPGHQTGSPKRSAMRLRPGELELKRRLGHER